MQQSHHLHGRLYSDISSDANCDPQGEVPNDRSRREAGEAVRVKTKVRSEYVSTLLVQHGAPHTHTHKICAKHFAKRSLKP